MMEGILKDKSENENVILVIRRHWMSMAPMAASTSLLLVLGLAGLFLPAFIPLKGFAYNIYLLAESLLFLLSVIFFYLAWVLNSLSYGVLTDERIVDIDQPSLFSANQSAARLDSIEDVTFSVSGLVQTVLNVGSLQIMTAAEIPNIEFSYVKNPQMVVEEIHRAQERINSIPKP